MTIKHLIKNDRWVIASRIFCGDDGVPQKLDGYHFVKCHYQARGEE